MDESKKSLSRYSELFNRNDLIKNALIQTFTNVCALLGVAVLYLNYILLQPYFYSLFWAVLVSVPLHSIKKSLIRAFSSKSASNPSPLSVVATLSKMLLVFLFGDLWCWAFPKSKSSARLETAMAIQVNSTHSGPHLVYLVRASVFYLTFLLVSNIGWNQWVVLLGAALLMLAIHVAIEVGRGFYRNVVACWFQWPELSGIVDKIDAWSFRIFSRIFNELGTLFRSSRKMYVVVKKDVKQEAKANTNSIVVILLLIFFVLCTIICSVFVGIQFFRETNIFIDQSMVFINDTVIHSQMIKDARFQEQVQSVLKSMELKAIQWSDTQLNEKLPGHNFTIRNLYQSALQIYHSMNDPDQYSLGSTEAKRSNELYGLIHKHFPKTLSISRYVIRGNFTALLDYNLLVESGTEIRTGLISLLHVFSHYDKDYIEDLLAQTQGCALKVGQALLIHSTLLFSYFSLLLLHLAHFLSYGFHLMAQLVLFLATLYYLLLADKSVLDLLGDVVYHVDKHQTFRTSMEKAINAIFLTTFRMFVFHALLTWLTFNLFQVQLVYIGTFVSGFIAMIPLLSPLWIVFPACFELYLKGRSIQAIILFLIHFLASWVVDPAIYSDIPDSHPYFSGMSIVLGLWAFGCQGIVFGPLLACLPVIGFHLYSRLLPGQKQD